MGSLTENVISECLIKCGFNPHYYRKNSGKDKMELDFVIETDFGLTIAEVKSGKTRDAPSIEKAMSIFEPDFVVKFEDSNIFVDDKGIHHFPLFAAAFFDIFEIEIP